jgi:hypothetical protein
MDFIALAFILVIAILSITILIMHRRNRRARKLDRYKYYPSRVNSSSINEMISQIREEEMKERSVDMKTASPDSAAMQGETGTKKVNVGRIYGHDEDIFWDEDEYDLFNTECRKNGYLPQEAFAAKMRLAENASKIKVLLEEMIEIENSYNRSKSENVSRLELIRSVISRLYI